MKYLLVVFSRDNKASLNLVKSSIDMVLFDFFSGIWPVNFIFLVDLNEYIACPKLLKHRFYNVMSVAHSLKR